MATTKQRSPKEQPQVPVKAPGRPPLPPGTTKEARASLRTTPSRLAKADKLAAAAKLSRNQWIERLIDAAKE